MQFLDRLSPEARARLLDRGRVLRLRRGETLIRRGEKGGDVYVVEEGSLEIVDSRSRPEVVLDVIGPGDVVGDMAFLDAAPRAADVRALSEATCRAWERAVLQEALDLDAEVGRSFYRALSERMAERHRHLATAAVMGGLGRRAATPSGAMAPGLAGQVREMAARARARWAEADARLRQDPEDAAAADEVGAALRDLVDEAGPWMVGVDDPDEATLAGALFAEEVQVWIGRAGLGNRALARRRGHAEASPVRVHVLRGSPEGDGPFGRALDRALLDLPTCRALRGRTAAIVAETRAALPADRPAEALLLGASCDVLLATLAPALGVHGARVVVLDHNRDALVRLDAAAGGLPESVDVRLVHHDLVRLCTGGSGVRLGSADVAVVDGLIEHLPDGLVAGLAAWVRDRGATVLVGSLAPAADAVVFDHLLDLPTIRRTPEEVAELLVGAGLRNPVVATEDLDGAPAVVIRAKGAAETRPSSASPS